MKQAFEQTHAIKQEMTERWCIAPLYEYAKLQKQRNPNFQNVVAPKEKTQPLKMAKRLKTHEHVNFTRTN